MVLIAIVSGEMATNVTLKKDKSGEYIECELLSENSKSRVELQLKPYISFNWSTLEA